MKISPHILTLVPYQPGKPISEVQREYGLDTVYKLASNESPLGASPRVKEAIREALEQLHRYPDGSCYELRQSVSSYYQVAPERLAFGNGSNEIIDLLIRVFCEPGQNIITSKGAFIAYKIGAQVARLDVIEVPLREDLTFDLDAIAAHMNASLPQAPRLVFIANPNNPTGTYVNKEELMRFMEHSQNWPETLVVLDEAYNEYVRAKDYPDTLQMQKQFRNLLIIRTFSKAFGMAGLRLGALIGDPEYIELIQRVRNPFNVNVLAQVAGVAAVADRDFIKKAHSLNGQGLDYYYQEFQRLGLRYWPSQGNFVLFDTGQNAQNVHQELLKKGVIMRPVSVYGFPTCLRVSVGTAEENQKAIAALKDVLMK